MSFLSKLPATVTSGENKGQVAYVTITNNNKLVEGEKVEFKIPQGDFEYPQFGPDPRGVDADGKETVRDLTEEEAQAGIQEFIQNCGSPQRALEVINNTTRDEALTGGKNKARLATTGERSSIIADTLRAVRDFSWVAVQRIKTADLRSVAEEIQKAGLDNLSADELRAMLKKAIRS